MTKGAFKNFNQKYFFILHFCLKNGLLFNNFFLTLRTIRDNWYKDCKKSWHSAGAMIRIHKIYIIN